MVSTIANVAFDCADAYRLATFWSGVVGHPLNEDDFPGDPVAVIQLPSGISLHFENVPEPKSVKNRSHLCLRPQQLRDHEVTRLQELGATMVADRREPDGTGWAVLADPEGNEFCVLRSADEVASTEPSPEAPPRPSGAGPRQSP